MPLPAAISSVSVQWAINEALSNAPPGTPTFYSANWYAAALPDPLSSYGAYMRVNWDQRTSTRTVTSWFELASGLWYSVDATPASCSGTAEIQVTYLDGPGALWDITYLYAGIVVGAYTSAHSALGPARSVLFGMDWSLTPTPATDPSPHILEVAVADGGGAPFIWPWDDPSELSTWSDPGAVAMLSGYLTLPPPAISANEVLMDHGMGNAHFWQSPGIRGLG